MQGTAIRQAPDQRGERRQVTALFADVVDFSEFASTADAEDLQDWLDGFYGQAREIVEAAGGEVTEFLGDGIVAVFGLSRAEEHAARRAVEAALRIVGLPCFMFPGGAGGSLRAGVATGEVATRASRAAGGPMPRMTGMVTTLAQRLQSAAAPGEVLIAPETHDLLRGALPVTARPDTLLKGFGAMTVYRVVPGGGLAQGAVTSGAAQPFIGRLSERGRILGASDRACLLVGPPGIGKTTLAGTFLEDGQPHAVFHADALNSGEGHAPFRQWLLNRLAPDPAGPAVLAAHFPALDADEILCLALVLGLPEGNALLARFSSTALRERLETALSRAIVTGVPSGVLLVEDLHWLDSASFGVVRRLIATLDPARHRLLMTSRETVKIHRHLSDLPIEIIGIDAFAPAESQAYLDAFGSAGLDPGARAELIRHAGGVPLFLEQLVKHAARPNPARGEIPATLSDLLTERIDATGPARPALLQASVLGRIFSHPLLEALAEGGPDISAMLAAAQAADIIRPVGPARWSFSHALLQRAAYRQLLRPTREALHARVAELLQTRCADLPDATPALLASHQSRAQQHLPAADSYLAASREALMRGAFADAEDHARAALTMCGQSADRAAASQPEIAAHTALGSILMQSQGFAAPAVRAAYAEVLRLARAEGAGQGNGAALFGSYSNAIIAGDREGADELCRLLDEAARAAEAGGLPDRDEIRLAAEAAANCGSFYSGEFRSQFAHLARIRALYDLPRHARMIARFGMDIFAAAQMFEVPARVFCGEVAPLTELLAETDRHQAALNIPVMQPYALIWGSVPLHAAGRLAEARERLDRGLVVATQQGAGFWVLTGQCWQHIIDPARSDSQAGRAEFRRIIDALRAIGVMIAVPYFTSHYAAALARGGQVQEAFQLSRAAVDEGWRSRLWCWQAETLRLHAGITLRMGRSEDAAQLLREAVALADRQGARLWQLRAALDLADLPEGDAGALAEARGHFAAGTALPELDGQRVSLVG
ncbi:adenylate/guanylate cyclase domain-containing protein [Paracoccus spongiarum]|uniref:Adenylate/guanylate cyclase domain-containing protein n=1 Tax=Paracoccus spongiarum TaxID=3064387 RepID=A0ABT9JB30_9RHOB|nr:adenylate/guanylate cyclase domain-containing protein [Paracoccus sp. 2205BS29-5]MDP5306950.1 adenylate/guanylate cyclase domain-containing protein [Paracoccus sp. 2205BS29-5]